MGVYGPDLVDAALDLLLDGVTGPLSMLPGERLTELEFARSLAAVADRDPALVVATGSPAAKPLFAWSDGASYLPPWETTLERFVREARAARRLGVQGVDRRMDEVREERAAAPAVADQAAVAG
jgi:dTDP-4-dehydrorhamnose reductase